MAGESQTKQRELEPRGKQWLEREGTRPGLVFRPDVDIVEQANEYLVTADLPGVDDQRVTVHLENGVLSIDATLAAQPETGWTPIYGEYRLGGFHREFTLSDTIDAGKISASMRDGVLELHLPKAERHRARTIEVRGS